jgi:hypothetical protein
MLKTHASVDTWDLSPFIVQLLNAKGFHAVADSYTKTVSSSLGTAIHSTSVPLYWVDGPTKHFADWQYLMAHRGSQN